jgi:putative sterol carrier protein
MPLPVFSDAWATACAVVLNQNDAYRTSAATWEGAILLLMTPDATGGEERRVFLDLWHGECRSARAASVADEAEARYVLAGTQAAWRLVLTGKVAPLLAIMTGKLRLAKGSLVELVPYTGAAKELVTAAAAIDATFPEGP